jgi:U3 small nucleolar RNA-associated protein 18
MEENQPKSSNFIHPSLTQKISNNSQHHDESLSSMIGIIGNPGEPKKSESPKWVDEEDMEIQISLNKKNHLKKLKKEKGEDLISGVEFQERLRVQFNKMNSGADIYKWAYQEESTSDSGSAEQSLENLLKTNISPLDQEGGHQKDSDTLKISSLPDLNKDHYHNSIISSLTFHPTKENIALTSGLDKKLKIFSIDPYDNSSSNIQTLNTLDMPIYSAKFLNDTEIVISGKRKHYFVYNLDDNKLERCSGLFSHYKEISSLEKLFVGPHHYAFATNEGYILLFDAKNKTFKYDIKISGSVNSVCFDRNGLNLYAVGDQSEIYVFDLRKYRNCVNKFSDSGNFNTTYMDITRDNSYLATGILFFQN